MRLGYAPHPPTGATCELARRRGRASHDRRDLVEGQTEHVVQDERDAFGGTESVEDHEEREPDRVAHERRPLRVDRVRRTYDRVGHVRRNGLLAPRPARAQHVQTDPRDDRRQPSAQVLDTACAGAAGVDPSFLDGVVRLAQRAEHAVCDRAQAGALCFESVGQPGVLGHGHVLESRFVNRIRRHGATPSASQHGSDFGRGGDRPEPGSLEIGYRNVTLEALPETRAAVTARPHSSARSSSSGSST